jgi:hypothetical protein
MLLEYVINPPNCTWERIVLDYETLSGVIGSRHGAVAQLVERFVRIEEVVVSITISSTRGVFGMSPKALFSCLESRAPLFYVTLQSLYG